MNKIRKIWQILKFLFRVRIHIAPGIPNCDNLGWLVLEHNTIQSFFFDWLHYGLEVALFNLAYLWTDEKER